MSSQKNKNGDNVVRRFPYGRSRQSTPSGTQGTRDAGENIRIARLRRRLTAEIVAQRAGTTRQTIAKVESGNPAVKAGTYAAVLQALGLLKGWGDLEDPVGEQMALDDLPQRARLKDG